MTTPSQQSALDLAIRCAWLSYVGGYTQAEIAERLGVSRVKVHRLIAAAHEAGAVKVFIEGEPAELISLEDTLMKRFGLESCSVVPDATPGEGNPFANVGTAAARYLRGRLDGDRVKVLAIGWGRTLAEMATRLPHIGRPDLKVVPVLGSVTRKMALNPYDVVHHLTDATGAEGYLLPVPLFADTPEHRGILLAQRSVQEPYALAAKADLTVVGLGAVPPDGHSLLQELGEISVDECRQLHRAGAEAEVVGQFLNAEGRLVDHEVNRRTLGVSLDVLRTHRLVAVAGGEEKTHATLSALKSGMLNGLITDEGIARRVIALTDQPSRTEGLRHEVS